MRQTIVILAALAMLVLAGCMAPAEKEAMPITDAEPAEEPAEVAEETTTSELDEIEQELAELEELEATLG